MPLTIGTQFGSHEIISLLGKGGMGEVYRARDTKLKRDVAIKILPDEFARDADRVSRFQREAELLASLNHPNIAAIYDVQETGGSRYLILELVEGETLAERLRRGPIPVEEALQIAKHICEAFEAAHEKGVIHRDLKPGNVKVTLDGKVKVLDFGLAKALEASPASSMMSNSPTLSLAGTNAGVILGTAAYMSPEQARGRVADQRSDVFSFGCVLYEMLTGRQAFQGEEVSDVLASVLKTEPDLSLLPAKLNSRIREVLRRCLEKNPKLRWHAIGDARVEIDAILADPRGVVIEETPAAVVKRSLWERAVPVAAAVTLSAITGVVVWNVKPSTPLQLTRFPLFLGEGQRFTNPGASVLTVSPDGTQLVYEANNQFYLRQMSEIEARPVPGTQSTQVIGAPIFSPDGRSLVYWSLADLALKKIAVGGGPSVTVCPAVNFFGGSWGESGIVFSLPSGIVRVSPNGAKPETLVAMKTGEVAYHPELLPGGDSVLFTVAKGQGAEWDNAQIVVQSLKSGIRKTLIERGTDGRYLPTGHIVYGFGGTLFAVPFDLRRLEVTGGQVPVVEGVLRTTFQFGGGLQFNFSKTGTLIYVPGPVSTTGEQEVLALMDREGKVEPLKIPPRPYVFPRISPDGKRVAFESDNGKDAHIWIYELGGAVAPRQLTVSGANRFPIWSPDGQWIAYQSDREGDLGTFRQRADGTGAPERLTKPEQGIAHIPDSWSHDGQHLSFTVVKSPSESAVWIYSVKDKKIAVFAQAESRMIGRAAFSPNDRWLAYTSNEMGRGNQVWVQPFPATGAKYPVAGGGAPTWSADGKEIFYVSGGNGFVVGVRTSPAFTFTEPMRLPSGPINLGTGTSRNWDVMPDGKHFIGVVAPGQSEAGSTTATAPQIQVVLNWFRELQERVPVK